MFFDTFEVILASDLAAAGTLDINYPDGAGIGTYQGAIGHELFANQSNFNAPGDFTVTFNATSFRITWGAGKTTILSGETIRIQLQRQGEDDGRPDDMGSVINSVLAPVVRIDLGSPDTKDANGLVEAEILDGAAVLGGALTANGVGTLDVPRNIIVTGITNVIAVTFTIAGEDVYDKVMVESFLGPAGAATTAGKKAFKTVTDVSTDGDTVVAVTVGPGDVLGLPVFLPSLGHILAELEDGDVATAGTPLVGVTATPIATTGDVRGTYVPDSTPNGSLGFSLLVALPDPKELGAAQFAG